MPVLSDTYPRYFRKRSSSHHAVAIFLFGAILPGFSIAHDPAFRAYGSWAQDDGERSRSARCGLIRSLSSEPLATSGIMTNNLRSSFSAFAMGIPAGVGTVSMILMRRLLLGVIGAATWKDRNGLATVEFRGTSRRARTAGNLYRGGAGLTKSRGVLLSRASSSKKDSLGQGGQPRPRRASFGDHSLARFCGSPSRLFSPSGAPYQLKFSCRCTLRRRSSHI